MGKPMSHEDGCYDFVLWLMNQGPWRNLHQEDLAAELAQDEDLQRWFEQAALSDKAGASMSEMLYGLFLQAKQMRETLRHRSPPQSMREHILWRDEGKCRYCGGAAAPQEHIDHVLPWSRGGITHPRNLVVACASCNLRKRDMTPAEANMELRGVW
jgi:hypothetical protein